MKARILLTFIVSLTLLISCKDEKKGVGNEQPIKENFSVELDVTVSKKDDFALYYTEDNTISFSGAQAVWRGVKGGNVDEKIVFELSEEIIPTDIRLDFGLNKEQELIELKNIKITYYGKELLIKGSDFFNYFVKEDKFKTEIDLAKGSIKFIISPDNYQTPYYYPRHELVDALKKLTTETK